MEHKVTFPNNGQTIVGILCVPETPASNKFPIVLILHGFTGTKNEVKINGTDEYMLERLSKKLARNGFAR